EGRAREHHGRHLTARAGRRDDADGAERQEQADRSADHALRDRQPIGEAERAVADPEHADVAGEPGQEELTRRALALALGDGVDAVGLDPPRDVRYAELGLERGHAMTPLISRKQA